MPTRGHTQPTPTEVAVACVIVGVILGALVALIVTHGWAGLALVAAIVAGTLAGAWARSVLQDAWVLGVR